MMNRRCLASVLALACALAPSGRALAQPAPPQGAVPAPPQGAAPASPQAAAPDEATARADALYKQGVQLYSEKKWKEAEAVFLEAWALTPTFDVAYNVGSAAYQQGKHARAAEHLSFALRHWPLLSAVAHLKPTAQQRLATSRAQVGALSVTVSAPLAEVLIDGKPAGKAPLAGELFVEPGEHTVEARLDGYAPAQKTVRVGKGETAAVALAMVAAKGNAAVNAGEKTAAGDAEGHGPSAEQPAAKPEQHVAVPGRIEQRSWIPVIALGAASAVALGVGIGTTVAANDAIAATRTQRTAIWTAGGACIDAPDEYIGACAEVRDGEARVDAFSNAARIAYVTSGLLLAGALTYSLWPARASASARSVRLVPNVGARSAGIIAQGAW
ncbi:PEGA domain-containing protein [Sorangium sp. So ce124]|uniref:PEGA domain-containing protein n=1 Tax=Sorangium sp. So ce124 TaxID=3133280 RepID=UPI003F5D5A05